MDDGVKEVHNMCDVAERLEKEGFIKGKYDILFSLVQKGKLSLKDASDEAQLPIDEFAKMLGKAGYKIPASV